MGYMTYSPSPNQGRARVLVVDHDTNACERLKVEMQSWGYNAEVEFAKTADELRHRLQAEVEPDLIIMELQIGADCGLNVFAEMKRTSNTPVLFWTAAGNIESAVAAAKMGAQNVLEKGADYTKLRIAIDEVLSNKPGANHTDETAEPMLGRSTVMRRLRRLIAEVAPTSANVLILGENGTGKELVAQEIHRQSRRASEAFVPVDLGAIPQALLESAIFGYRKGAYTGAHANTKGSCETADGGTLFLDEIGELALELQPKLLRFLERGLIQQVGSPTPRPVDARVIAATNRDLREMVQQGLFRQDLYYRLNVFPIHVPALRDRPEDIELLAPVFAVRFAQRHEKQVLAFTPAALEVLLEYDWPGNIRELENLVERMIICCGAEEISADTVVTALGDDSPTKHNCNRPSLGAYTVRMDGVTEIEKAEIAAIVSALRKTGGNATLAARQLGLGQATVYRKLKKYGIKRRDKDRNGLVPFSKRSGPLNGTERSG